MSGVTIGQAAAFAGVTVKTVRHYHRLGLVKEPKRDRSGYRRYGSKDLLRLVQVRTLAAAGVPLAEINGLLLHADPARFAAAIAEVERRLNAQIDELISRRETLRRLARGDRAMLSDRACAMLERIAALGFSAEFVESQREAMVLFGALMPDGYDHFLTQLEHRFADAEFVDLMKRSWDVLSWSPDDPRIDELASALAAKLLANRALLEAETGFLARPDAAKRYGLVNRHREDESPAIARLTALTEAKLRAAGIAVPNQ